jgi:hypothetical protein
MTEHRGTMSTDADLDSDSVWVFVFAPGAGLRRLSVGRTLEQ